MEPPLSAFKICPLVGSDSREHPFVDEGLAQYSAVLYMEDRYGAARARAEASDRTSPPARHP